MKRFGGMVSFRVTGGEQHALEVCDSAEVFTLGESLGGVESLIEHPGRMTHASVAGTELEVPADLIRLSVGIETAEDLVADLDRAWLSLGELAVCVDFGSTFTKASLVDLAAGRIVGPRSTAPRSRPTCSTGTTRAWPTLVAHDPRAADAEVLACSSAGGGLRIAVIGNEELVTAEAGRRVALSSGGRVVSVARRVRAQVAERTSTTRRGRRRGAADRRHRRRQPRGAARAARELVGSRVAGSGRRRRRTWTHSDEVGEILRRRAARARRTTSCRASVCSRRDRPEPPSGRCSSRHVIGGKHLSSRADFTAMVRGRHP